VTWLAYFTLLAQLAQPAPTGCKRHALEQGSGTVLVCEGGKL
jgi:hypothetical protein